MNIWLVNHYAVQPKQGGGTRHYDLAQELNSRGYDVTVWATSRSHSDGSEYRVHEGWRPVVEYVDGVRWVWIRTTFYHGNGPRRGLNMISFFFNFLISALFWTTHSVPKPDLIVGSSVHPLTPLATWMLSRYWRLPALTEIRDIWPEALLEYPLSRYHPAYLLFEVIEKFVYRYSDGIVTLLPNSMSHIEELGADPDNIFWVPNGSGMEIVAREPLDGPFRAIYLGSISRQYRLEFVLQAARILQQRSEPIEIILQGGGPDRERLEGIARELNLSNVTFKEQVPKSEVPGILSRHDALIYSTPRVKLHKFGLSANKLFDYLASGRPVLFACGAVNNPVEQAKAGVSVTPGEPEEIADGLVQLMRAGPEERQAMGQRGQQFIAEHHTISAICSKFERAVLETAKKWSSKRGG